MQPYRFHDDTRMAATLTLKNIPDDVYERLKHSASLNRRSINNEAIVCLDATLAPIRPSLQERLRCIHALREGVRGALSLDDMESIRNEGRA